MRKLRLGTAKDLAKVRSVKGRLTADQHLLIYSAFTPSWLWPTSEQPEGIALDKSGQQGRNLRKPR